MEAAEQQAPDVAGFSLAGTSPYVISAEESRVVYEASGAAPPQDGTAHPIYFFIATQVGMGQTVAGLCEVCHFDVNDGPMMGGSRVDYVRPLLTDRPYQVTGRIVALTRKRSRKFGVMDVLEYELSLLEQDGAPVLTTTNTWVLPRRHLAGAAP